MTSSARRANRGLYEILLLCYPRAFRLRFRSEMVGTFSDLISGEWERNGAPGVARVWWSALGEVFSVAVPLRLESPMAVAIPLALASSLALFLTAFHAMTHVCGE